MKKATDGIDAESRGEMERVGDIVSGGGKGSAGGGCSACVICPETSRGHKGEAVCQEFRWVLVTPRRLKILLARFFFFLSPSRDFSLSPRIQPSAHVKRGTR